MITLIHGNCITEMKKIGKNTISGCITDPPYNYEFIGKDWNVNEIKRRTERVKVSKTLIKNIPYGSGLSGGVRNEAWYKKNRNNVIDYQNWIKDWGKELYRVLKPGAYVFTFNSTRTIANVQTALEDVGFYARDIIVWRRNSGIPKGLNASLKMKKMGVADYNKWQNWNSCLRNEWEAISVVQKPLENNYINTLSKYGIGLLYTLSDENGFQSNIIENIKQDVHAEFNTHITIKPKDLIKKLIKIAIPLDKDNIVIDPFLGSGTTAVAAKELGIQCIGIDIEKEYLDIAHQRLNSVSD